MSDEGTPPEGGTGGDKAGQEFKPIASQADLDRIIGERLARAKAQYADYDDLKTKAAEFDRAAESQKSELQKAIERAEAAEQKAAKYETDKQVDDWAKEIVKDSPIPASVLRGRTKEELVEHFEQLKAALPAAPQPKRTHVPPGKPVDGDKTGSRAAAALREMRRG